MQEIETRHQSLQGTLSHAGTPSTILFEMKLARFWTRASGTSGDVRVVSRGWSNESLEDAAAVARDIAQKVAQRVASGLFPPNRYLYGDRPLPEPTLREFGGDGAGASAVLTRNSYGSVILNTRDLMFVDIDRDGGPAPAASVLQPEQVAEDLVSSVLSFFGKQPARPAAPAMPAPPPPADSVVSGIQQVAERQGLSARVYKTAAGYRALIVNTKFEPNSTQTENLLREFGADPLYVRLCRMQESFRARLSPKPWRCGATVPPVSFPFTTPQDEARFREWEAGYNAAAASYATCHYLSSCGIGSMDPALEELVFFHDQFTKATSSLPLA